MYFSHICRECAWGGGGGLNIEADCTFHPSQAAVCDRELCSAEGGLLFLSWPPPERCSQPLSHSVHAYVCAASVGQPPAILTCLLSSASHPGHMSGGLQSTWAAKSPADMGLMISVLQPTSLDNAGEISLIRTSGPELWQHDSAPNPPAVYHCWSGLWQGWSTHTCV